jgi:hypothetical protein
VLHCDLLNDNDDDEALRLWCRVDATSYFTSPRTLQLAEIAQTLLAAHVCDEATLVASLTRYPHHIMWELCCLAVVTSQWYDARDTQDTGVGTGAAESSVSPAQSAVIEALLQPQPPSSGRAVAAGEGMWALHPALAAEAARYSFPLCRCLVEGHVARLVWSNTGHPHNAAWGRLMKHLVGQGGEMAAYARAVGVKYDDIMNAQT